MHNYNINNFSAASKHKLSLRTTVLNYLKNIKTSTPVRYQLFGASAVVATALVVSTIASSGATVSDSQAAVQPAQNSQPLVTHTNGSSEINVQSQTLSNNALVADPKPKPSSGSQVTVSAEGETIEQNGNGTTRQTINSDNGTTHVDIKVNSTDNDSTSSHTRIKSHTSSSSSDINIKSEVRVSN